MQSQRLVIAQKQQLKLSPQMYQSLELMALPIMDLRERIQTEIEKNPALQINSTRDISFERFEQRTQRSGTIDPFENSSDPGYIRKSNQYDPDSKHKFIQGALAREESLQEHLLEQLHFLKLDVDEVTLGELLISNLDQNGFYRDPPEALVDEKQQPLLKKMITTIRTFDPPGICTANYLDSLLLQVDMDPTAPPFAGDIVANHLETIRRGKLDVIAKAYSIDIEDVELAVHFIKSLNPYPGSIFSQESTQYIVPDLAIRSIDGKLVLQMNSDQLPLLKIDPEFVALGSDAGHLDRETDSFIQKSIRSAQFLISSIEMRNATLRKVGAVLLKHQFDFFIKGPRYLRPLTLKDVADQIEVHETTVSRISNAKHIQTDWGIFPIKYFFSNAVQGKGDDGKAVSKTGVKEIVREIIENYEGKKRLSDQKIADLLLERGITIARRTVAKYRRELNIDSSFDRSK